MQHWIRGVHTRCNWKITPGVIFQFEIESCGLSLFPYHSRLWWLHVYWLCPYSGLNRPERKGRCLALVPYTPPVSAPPGNKEGKKCGIRKFLWNFPMSWEEIDVSLLLRRSWSTLPLSSSWTVDAVLRLEDRCNLVGCSQMDGCRTVSSVGTWTVECVVLAPDPLVQVCQSLVVWFTHSIDDRPLGLLVDVVFSLCRRWPLDLSTSSRLALNSVRTRKSPPQMSSLLSLRSTHCALSFVVQFVVIWLITCQTEVLVRS